MIVVFFFGILALILLYDYVNKSKRVWKLLCQFPGDTALPLVGNALELGLNPEDVQQNLERLWRKFDMKSFRMMIGSEPMLFICEPKHVQNIICNPIVLHPSEHQVEVLREFFGNSLIQSTGEKWRMMRKLLTPLFHPSLLEEHLKIANTQGVILMDKLRAHIDGPSFDINPYLINFGLDVFCSALLGLNANAQNGEEQEYAKATQKVLPIVIRRVYSLWYRFDFIYKMSPLRKEAVHTVHVINSYLDKIIDFRRKEFQKKIVPKIESEEDVVKYISVNRKNLTFTDVMLLSKLPNGEPIPQAWIREETNLLMFAGFDTIKTTIGFAVTYLAKYKDLQQKVYEEQKEILGDDRNREPSLKELGEMSYLQRFIKESMRIRPTVGQFTRKLNADVTLDDGRVLAAGTTIVVYTGGLHMNPQYFSNPEVFDPDRFLEPVSPYIYIPFGAGPRICIGMNYGWMAVRSVLSKLIRNYELSQAGPQDDPIPLHQIVNISKNGFRVMIKERK